MNPNTDLNKPGKIGLALSGGGIRGVAHLGVMQALVDRGIKFSHISGTSAGAVAAAFFAHGCAPKEILKIITQAHLLRLLRPSIGSTGLLSILHAEGLLKEYFPDNSFKKLKIPITVAAVDFGEGKLTYFNSGELINSLLASCCLPGLFKPIMIKGHMYVDGGILNNFPVEPLVGICDLIIGSSCNHLEPVTEIHSFGQMVDRAAMLAVNASLDMRKSLCDVVIEPHGLGSYGIFDTSKAEYIYMIGYEEGLKALEGNVVLKALVAGKHRHKPSDQA